MDTHDRRLDVRGLLSIVNGFRSVSTLVQNRLLNLFLAQIFRVHCVHPNSDLLRSLVSILMATIYIDANYDNAALNRATKESKKIIASLGSKWAARAKQR